MVVFDLRDDPVNWILIAASSSRVNRMAEDWSSHLTREKLVLFPKKFNDEIVWISASSKIKKIGQDQSLHVIYEGLCGHRVEQFSMEKALLLLCCT